MTAAGVEFLHQAAKLGEAGWTKMQGCVFSQLAIIHRSIEPLTSSNINIATRLLALFRNAPNRRFSSNFDICGAQPIAGRTPNLLKSVTCIETAPRLNNTRE